VVKELMESGRGKKEEEANHLKVPIEIQCIVIIIIY
jgi:hypothetical protein